MKAHGFCFINAISKALAATVRYHYDMVVAFSGNCWPAVNVWEGARSLLSSFMGWIGYISAKGGASKLPEALWDVIVAERMNCP